MNATKLEQEIIDVIHSMTPEMQREALDRLRQMARPKGTPGWEAVQHAREIAFPKEDLKEIAQAIEEWCERIDDFPEVSFRD